MEINTKTIVLLFDLYWLRFKKPGEQWYELTDYVRDKLVADGVGIKYTKDDLLATIGDTILSMKKISEDRIKLMEE